MGVSGLPGCFARAALKYKTLISPEGDSMSSLGNLTAKFFTTIMFIFCLSSGAWGAGLRIVPSSPQVTPGESFYFDVVADNIPASGLSGVQFRVNAVPSSGSVVGVSELAVAGSGDIAVVAPLMVSQVVPGRSGVGDFFWNAKGTNGILVMDNEPLVNGSGLYSFAHTSGSTPPSGSGVVARFAGKIGAGVKAERLNLNLGDVMLLDGGPAYPLEYATGAAIQIQCVTKVPAVTGLDRNAAVAALTAARLVLGNVYEVDNTGGSRQLNVVLEQSVAADSTQLCQTPVNLAINTPPADVSNVVAIDKANDESGAVLISWTPSASPDAAGYRMYSNGMMLKQLPGASMGDMEISGLTNGTAARLRLAGYDTFGNESGGVVFDVLPKDDVPPVITIAGLSDGLLSRLDVTPQITAKDAGTVTWSAVLDGIAFNVLPVTAEGRHTLVVTAVDKAGNSSSKSASFTIDKSAPVLSVSTLANGSSTSNPNLSISGSANDSNGIKELKINNVTVSLSQDGSFSYQLPLVIGSNTVSVVVSDVAGNQTVNTRTVIRQLEVTVAVNAVPNPVTASSYKLTGTMGVGTSLNISTTSTATVGAITYPSTGTWACEISRLASGSNEFAITALDQSGNTRTINVTLNYVPSFSITLSNSSVASDFKGVVTAVIKTGSPAGSEVFVEQFVDANRNGTVDPTDYVIRSFKVTDGVASNNPNKQGDDDGAADSSIKTGLNFMLADDLYHAPGRYVFRASMGTDSSSAVFSVNPVSTLQSVTGSVTDGASPVAGALVRLLDKWKRPVAWTVADESGNFVLNVKKSGDYLLLPVSYGYMSSAVAVSVADGQQVTGGALAVTAGSYHVTGQVKDAAGSKGVPGVMIQAMGDSGSAFAITSETGSYDVSLASGQFVVNVVNGASVPGAYSKGYVGFEAMPVNVTVSDNQSGVDISLVAGDVQVRGRVVDTMGNPVAGVPVRARQTITNDNSEPSAYGVSDTNGNYSLWLIAGANWDVMLEDSLAQSLGYIGTVRRGFSTDAGPLTGNDLTVFPITSWVQGTVKDSETHLLSAVDVVLRNQASTIATSIPTASDGVYRLGTYAGSWLVKARTEATGSHQPVNEQAVTTVDTQTTTADFVVDVTPPVLSVNAVVSPTTQPAQTISGSMESGSVVVVSVNTSAVAGIVSYPMATTWSCTISGLTAGTNNITVTATDAAGNVTTKTTTISYNQPKLPDLVVISLGTPSTASSGQTISIPVTVKNQGAATSGLFYVGLYLSSDSNITTADKLLGSEYISSLAAGAQVSYTTTVTIPANTSGTYYIGAVADIKGKITEISEDNNSKADIPTTISFGPDLVVTSVAAPATASSGQTISIPVTVKNQGTGSAGLFYVGVYLSSDSTITASDTFLGSEYISSLSPGSVESYTTTVTIPENLTGTYYIGAIADIKSKISESSEDNNSYAGASTAVTYGPDLVVSSISYPASAVRGQSVQVPVVVKNQGSGSCGLFYIGLYLSSDDNISKSDISLGEEYISSLTAGGQESYTTTVTIPSDLAPGNYYIGAIVDTKSKIGESNENNNMLPGASIAVTQ